MPLVAVRQAVESMQKSSVFKLTAEPLFHHCWASSLYYERESDDDADTSVCRPRCNSPSTLTDLKQLSANAAMTRQSTTYHVKSTVYPRAWGRVAHHTQKLQGEAFTRFVISYNVPDISQSDLLTQTTQRPARMGRTLQKYLTAITLSLVREAYQCMNKLKRSSVS